MTEPTRPLAPIDPEEAVITKTQGLPKYVVHGLGLRDRPEDMLQKSCYKNALLLADENQQASIAFPAISTGAFGSPVREAASAAFQVIKIQPLIFVILNGYNLFSGIKKTTTSTKRY